MARHALASLAVCGLAIVAVTLPIELSAAKKVSTPQKKPIKNPKFDPSADQVDLFDAVDAGHVTVRLIPEDAMNGTVLIENKTDKALTVKIPEAVVGISIHAQLFNGNGAGNLFGNGANNNLLGGQNGMTGGQQMQGGGIPGQNQGNFPGAGQQQQNPFGNPFGNQNGPANGPGNGFFSIPAEKVVSLPFNSVCLEHGKADPTPNSKYTLIPVSRISKDPVLYQLLTAVGSGKVDTQAAQAAAWHLTDNLSFQDLAEKTNAPLPGIIGAPYFSRDQLIAAKDLLSQATDRADKAAANTAQKADAVPRTAQASAN